MHRVALAAMLSVVGGPYATAQTESPPPAVRVRVVLNADGSRTVYQTDVVSRKSTATTTEGDGTVRDTINYELDENGRAFRSEVLGPKNQFRFFAHYKYDANGRVIEETRLTKDQTVIERLVLRYDDAGHQIGFSAYDGSGRLLGQTGTATPSAKRK